LAFLRPAPVRGHLLGAPARLESSAGGAARQLVLRSARRAALVLRQYRRAPCASLEQQDSVLPVAESAAGIPGAFQDRAAHADGKFPRGAAHALGRDRAAADFLPRIPPALRNGVIRLSS